MLCLRLWQVPDAIAHVLPNGIECVCLCAFSVIPSAVGGRSLCAFVPVRSVCLVPHLCPGALARAAAARRPLTEIGARCAARAISSVRYVCTRARVQRRQRSAESLRLQCSAVRCGAVRRSAWYCRPRLLAYPGRNKQTHAVFATYPERPTAACARAHSLTSRHWRARRAVPQPSAL